MPAKLVGWTPTKLVVWMPAKLVAWMPAKSVAWMPITVAVVVVACMCSNQQCHGTALDIANRYAIIQLMHLMCNCMLAVLMQSVPACAA